MVFHESVLGFASSNSIAIFGGVGIIVVITFLIWYSVRSSGLRYGSWDERRALRGLGYTPLGIGGLTGRRLYRGLRSLAKGSFKLGKFAVKAGKKGGKIAKDVGMYTSRLIRGEEKNIEAQLHESAGAAASVELATVIGKLANAELNEHKSKRSIETSIKFLDSQLAEYASFHNIGSIDEEARQFLVRVGNQITSALIELAHHENYELNIRRTSFDHAYELLETVKKAEEHVKSVIAQARRNQIDLGNRNVRVIKDLEKYLKDRLREENQKITKVREAFSRSAGATSGLRTAMYNEMKLVEQSSAKIKDNINKLISVLVQLKSINFRMLKLLSRLRDEMNTVLALLAKAKEKERQINNTQKTIDRKVALIKEHAKSAQIHFQNMQRALPEEIIIDLTKDSGSIFEDLIGVTEAIAQMDEKELLPFMDKLREAMNEAFRIEESIRIANQFYERLIVANARFYELVRGADFSEEVKATIIQEDEVQKLEERIASKEVALAQASKSLFIRTKNIIEEVMQKLIQHIEFLKNNIILTRDTENYTLNILSTIMEKLAQHKIRANEEFGKKAEEYQQRLKEARFQESLAKMAA